MSKSRTTDDDLEARLRGALHEIGDDALRILSVDVSPQDFGAPRQRRRSRSMVPLLVTAAVAVVVGAAITLPRLFDAQNELQPAGEGLTSSSIEKSRPPARPDRPNAVDRVSARVSSLWREPGYGKVVVDYETAAVRVFWQGSPPPDLERLRGTTIDGVEVSIVDVAYSDSDMAVAARKVIQRSETSTETVKISHAFASKDFSALVVVVLRTDSVSDVAALEKSLAKVARMPVVVEFTKDEFVDGSWPFRNKKRG